MKLLFEFFKYIDYCQKSSTLDKMILSTVIMLTYTITAIHGEKLHEYMTKEEIESVFNIKHDDVHKIEYEVVPIYHKHDSLANVKLRTFNRNYDLYLEKNNHVLIGQNTPVYLAKTNPSLQRSSYGKPAITYTRISYPLPINFELYHDIQNRAALSAHRDTDKVHLNGVIGDNAIVRSIPTRVHREVLSKFRFPLNDSFSSGSSPGEEYQKTQHIIIKPTVIDNKEKHKDIYPINLSGPSRPTRSVEPSRSLDPLKSPDTVYPELLITIDYETFKINNQSVESVAKYIAAFWNAVDLRYREISNPKVRLNIAGLIIPQETGAAPYFESNRIDSKIRPMGETLKAIGNHFGRENRFPKKSYDIVVGFTPLRLQNIKDGKVSYAYGVAYAGTACLPVWSTALVSDNGSFNGITTAAHELAHVMGTPHDEDETNQTNPCPKTNGYLMSYGRRTAKGLHWSSCSMQEMRNFLRSEKASCLWNKPNPGKSFPKILPGKLVDRNTQCQREMGRNADSRATHDCVSLWCDGRLGSKPPAEGTSCGNGKICLDAQCVKDPELKN